MSRSRNRLDPFAQGNLFEDPAMSAEVHKVGGSAEEDLMTVAVRPDVVSEAISRVKANGGSPGVDGMTVRDLDAFWRSHGEKVCRVLVCGDYIPRPVRRVTIPKPGGGERDLGVPTVVDRVVQQMLLIVLEPRYEALFSDSSYGFRPNRSAHDAVKKAREYVASGLDWVVDLDLERFFDRVNHDVLMSRLALRISDKRVLKLIRRFLNSGVMLNGVVMDTEEGTPQGGPLSPLLANALLDDFDKELERRGLHFVRYADDCNIYVGSQRAAARVLETATNFLEVKLRLKVNRLKSASAQVSERKFLGFTICRYAKGAFITISDKSLKRFKDEIRKRSSRVRRIPSRNFIDDLNRYMTGWAGYYARVATGKEQLEKLDWWVRRRVRQWLWVQWKTPYRRYTHLIRAGIPEEQARKTMWTRSAWRAAGHRCVERCINNSQITKAGLTSLLDHKRRLASL
ncbi:MAG: group II intron reverse transcriptase/maturase [Fimbriimonas sp.]|nr:group II intron reverse transcriptase/maturase [Fimbriimonas sp.]